MTVPSVRNMYPRDMLFVGRLALRDSFWIVFYLAPIQFFLLRVQDCPAAALQFAPGQGTTFRRFRALWPRSGGFFAWSNMAWGLWDHHASGGDDHLGTTKVLGMVWFTCHWTWWSLIFGLDEFWMRQRFEGHFDCTLHLFQISRIDGAVRYLVWCLVGRARIERRSGCLDVALLLKGRETMISSLKESGPTSQNWSRWPNRSKKILQKIDKMWFRKMGNGWSETSCRTNPGPVPSTRGTWPPAFSSITFWARISACERGYLILHARSHSRR